MKKKEKEKGKKRTYREISIFAESARFQEALIVIEIVIIVIIIPGLDKRKFVENFSKIIYFDFYLYRDHRC